MFNKLNNFIRKANIKYVVLPKTKRNNKILSIMAGYSTTGEQIISAGMKDEALQNEIIKFHSRYWRMINYILLLESGTDVSSMIISKEIEMMKDSIFEIEKLMTDRKYISTAKS